MPGLLRNSLDKIVTVYFSGVTAQKFEYAGQTYRPKIINVSPLLFRGTTCPMACGGCCFRFVHLYLPTDPMPESPHLRPEVINFNGVSRQLVVDRQDDHDDHFCRHLIKPTGRCGIHGEHPFTCDFELIRFTHQDHRVDIATRLFGRGWSYLRTTGQVGAQCDVLPVSEKHRDDAARKLKRLKEWTDYWSLETHLPQVIDWVERGPHETPLVIHPGKRTLLFYAKTT